MVQVTDVAVSFGNRRIFDRLSFHVADTDKVGLVGNNGTGKTTILRMLARELEPDSGTIRSSVSGICYIPQHISTKDPVLAEQEVLTFMLEGRGLSTIRMRIEEIEYALERNDVLSEGVVDEYLLLSEEFKNKGGYKAESDIGALLSGVGLGDPGLSRRVSHLSGGQRTKLMLAKMLYQQSDLLLLDEPTNHIDPESVAWLAGYLAHVRKSIVVVSHNPVFLDGFVKRIISLEGIPARARSYRGNYSSFVRQKRGRELTEAREQQGLAAEIKRQQGFIDKASQHQVGLKHAREKSVEKLKQRQTVTSRTRGLKFDFPVGVPLSRYALCAKAISRSYGKKRVFDSVSLDLKPDERVGIIGDNGAGKSTLLRVLAGESSPDRGVVERNPKLQVDWYRQEQDDLDDSHTILDEVRQVCPDKKRVRSILAHFLFPADRVDQLVGTLSRGERARLCFARMVLSSPNLLLLDEPTNHLDQSSKEALIEALQVYKGALVVVTHDTIFLGRIGITWAISMPKGKLTRLD